MDIVIQCHRQDNAPQRTHDHRCHILRIASSEFPRRDSPLDDLPDQLPLLSEKFLLLLNTKGKTVFPDMEQDEFLVLQGILQVHTEEMR